MEQYLGPDENTWCEYNVSELIRRYPNKHVLLVDQGSADPFLKELRLGDLKSACKSSGQQLLCTEHEGYDHSYFFVSTFIGDHLRFHAEALL